MTDRPPSHPKRRIRIRGSGGAGDCPPSDPCHQRPSGPLHHSAVASLTQRRRHKQQTQVTDTRHQRFGRSIFHSSRSDTAENNTRRIFFRGVRRSAGTGRQRRFTLGSLTVTITEHCGDECITATALPTELLKFRFSEHFRTTGGSLVVLCGQAHSASEKACQSRICSTQTEQR